MNAAEETRLLILKEMRNMQNYVTMLFPENAVEFDGLIDNMNDEAARAYECQTVDDVRTIPETLRYDALVELLYTLDTSGDYDAHEINELLNDGGELPEGFRCMDWLHDALAEDEGNLWRAVLANADIHTAEEMAAWLELQMPGDDIPASPHPMQ
jgi:hypothetical protein